MNGLLGNIRGALGPDAGLKAQAIGDTLIGLGMGQPVASPAYNALMQRQQRAEQMRALEDSGMIGSVPENIRPLISQLPPEAAVQWLLNWNTRQPERAKPIEVNGQLIDPTTFQVLGDYRTPEGKANVVVASTPEDKAKWGIPDDGKPYEIEYDPETMQLLNVSGIGGGGVSLNQYPPPPPGFMYEFDAEGRVTGQRPIPGSDADMSRQGAQAAIDADLSAGQSAIDLAKAIRDDPALPSITGTFQGRLPSGIPVITGGQEGANLSAKIEQLQGKTFLQAYEMLKGGGPITDIEGQKAERAMARLQTAQDELAYKAALNDFIAAIEAGMKKLRATPAQADEPLTEEERRYLGLD